MSYGSLLKKTKKIRWGDDVEIGHLSTSHSSWAYLYAIQTYQETVSQQLPSSDHQESDRRLWQSLGCADGCYKGGRWSLFGRDGGNGPLSSTLPCNVMAFNNVNGIKCTTYYLNEI